MPTNELTVSRERIEETPVVKTTAARLARLSEEPPIGSDSDQERWRQLMDEQLIEWGRRGAELFDDDMEPPTGTAIVAASKLVGQMRSESRLAPTRMVPDACGGIAFELDRGSISERLEIDAEGAVEYLQFVNGRIVSRYEVVLHS